MRQGLVDHIESGGKSIPAESLVNFKIIEAGQVVMNRMRAAAGLFGVASVRGLVSPDYAIFEPKPDAFSPYLLEAFRLPSLSTVFRSESKGLGTGEAGFLRLYTDRFGSIPVPYPPLDEQRLIVRFLDWHGGRTTKLIRAKKKLIALLNEQKQAIIHRAVTRGLDPSVKLQSTQIPALGHVPQHWMVVRLRNIVERIEQGVSPQAEGGLAEANSWGVLKSGCVNRGLFRDTEHKRLRSDFTINPNIIVSLGDVLVSRASGSPSLVGSVARVNSLRYRLILSDKTFRCMFKKAVDSDFMVLAMNSRYYRDQVEQAISGAEGLANNLPVSSLKDFMFVVPPLKEAQYIAVKLGERVGAIDIAISQVEREIFLIQEFRTRLIADVVTGKLDVRALATSLPEIIEPEAIGEPIDDEDLDDVTDDTENEEAAA